MKIQARMLPNKRQLISCVGIGSIFTSFAVALAAYLSVLTPTGKASPGCALEWTVLAIAQADFQTAVDVLTIEREAWYQCIANDPSNCALEETMVALGEADLETATTVLHAAEDAAMACEYGY